MRRMHENGNLLTCALHPPSVLCAYQFMAQIMALRQTEVAKKLRDVVDIADLDRLQKGLEAAEKVHGTGV